MTATVNNGKIRRTLADQIDRLDRVLDGLADSLNEAVATTVKEAAGSAVQEAVRQALVEVLTNPDVLALIGGIARANGSPQITPDEVPPVTESRSGFGERLGTLGEWAGRQVRAARSACARAAAAGGRCLGSLGARLVPLWHFRKEVVVALAVGATAGLVAYMAGPWVGGLLSGLAAFASALTVQAGLWLRRLVADVHFINPAN